MVVNTNKISNLFPNVVKLRDGGISDSSTKDFGNLIIKFLWVRDQAHIFHWQTKSNSHHVALGEFYESYLEELDKLAESIFGKTGKTFTVGTHKIELVDYSGDNLKKYLTNVCDLFEKEFIEYFPNKFLNLGIYNILGDIVKLINKLKYILSQK
jgi:hypothetical protein